MLKQIRSCLVFCTLVVVASATLAAQESRGTLQGRVTDSSGAAVPGATVEVLNLATGVVVTSVTNEQGSYRAPLLNPGNYRVTVSLTGFNKFVSDQIELHVADVLTVDAALKVGSLSDEVTVTATAATVDTTPDAASLRTSSRRLVIGMATLVLVDLVGGLVAVATDVNTWSQAWGTYALLAAPLPMILGQGLRSDIALQAAYDRIQPMSIDYAVMEGAARDHRVVTATLDVGWSDLGGWPALLEALGRPVDGGVVNPGQEADTTEADLLVERTAEGLVVRPAAGGRMTSERPVALLRGAADALPIVQDLLDRCAAAEAGA